MIIEQRHTRLGSDRKEDGFRGRGQDSTLGRKMIMRPGGAMTNAAHLRRKRKKLILTGVIRLSLASTTRDLQIFTRFPLADSKILSRNPSWSFADGRASSTRGANFNKPAHRAVTPFDLIDSFHCYLSKSLTSDSEVVSTATGVLLSEDWSCNDVSESQTGGCTSD